jgi:hypothetical protein
MEGVIHPVLTSAAVVGTGMAAGSLWTAVSGRQGTSSRGATRQR